MSEIINIENKIYTIRGIQVMLDSDLAKLYGVETKNLNRAVKRNIKRFPENFRFQLTKEEYDLILKCQNGTLNKNLRCQNGTSSLGNYGGRRYLPYVFTEQGVSMLSTVLKSNIAIEVSIKIIETFVKMRNFLLSNAAIFQRIDNIEYKILEHDKHFNKIFNLIESQDLKPIQGIFHNGQIYDAYKFVNDLFKSAKKEIILIDNYIDDNVLTLFSKYPKLKFKIITKGLTKQLEFDIKKYNLQYKNLEIKISNKFHDRFLIIDNKETYHIGASLKDLGKKIFGFNKIDFNLIKNILDNF